eukprot:COSAG02_NODE_350_length_24063_cov_47.131447_8_plen_110_part_00
MQLRPELRKTDSETAIAGGRGPTLTLPRRCATRAMGIFLTVPYSIVESESYYGILILIVQLYCSRFVFVSEPYLGTTGVSASVYVGIAAISCELRSAGNSASCMKKATY